jgi:DNA invertase Pin-like site-specific DNA recombinase
MMVVGESAARWLRVSTGGQDEANQEPDIDQWCKDQGYVVRQTYTLRGKSASKGQQDKMLDKMIEDMLRGVFTVLVVWASDRIERRGAYNAFDLARRVKEAGGRIEYVKDTYLNSANEMSDVMLALAATKDHLESKRKAQRTEMVNMRIRAAGAFVGKPPFGYKAEGEKYSKQLVPTEAGRRLIPEMYERCISGDSLAKIGAWLEQETGIPWWPPRVSGTLKNPVYRGVQEDDQGRPIHHCEALVDAATWRRAIEALGRHGKRGPENKLDPALLSGVLFCPRCAENGIDSPMYRHRAGKRNANREWYRCAGRGTQRKGCGNMIRLTTLDGIVNLMLRKNDLPYQELRTIPGTDHAAEIEEVRFEIRSVMMSDLSDDEIDERVKELRAERDRLQALPVVPDRVEYVETGETYGQIWKKLSPAERGPWLRKRGYKVGATRGRVVILDATGAEIFEYTSHHRAAVHYLEADAWREL